MVRCDRHIRRVRGLSSSERVEILPAFSWRITADEMACRERARRAKRIDPRAVMIGGEHGNAARVGAHGCNCRIVDRDVERHGYRTRSHDAEQCEYGFLAAVHQQRDTVAWSTP